MRMIDLDWSSTAGRWHLSAAAFAARRVAQQWPRWGRAERFAWPTWHFRPHVRRAEVGPPFIPLHRNAQRSCSRKFRPASVELERRFGSGRVCGLSVETEIFTAQQKCAELDAPTEIGKWSSHESENSAPRGIVAGRVSLRRYPMGFGRRPPGRSPGPSASVDP